MSGVYHGGDLSFANAKFGNPVGGWIDLSTGINPWPWVPPNDTRELMYRLPDREMIRDLCTAAADFYGVGETADVVPSSGSQALIQWLPRLVHPGRVLVVSPTYGEHAAAWRSAGHHVEESHVIGNFTDYNVVVLTSPNNPDGRIFPQSTFDELSESLFGRGGFLVVDEAFADLDPTPSAVSSISKGIVALRSLGKFFGLPGLRLGFALTDSLNARKIENVLGPWAVSTVAAHIGSNALRDLVWQAEMRKRLAIASKRMDIILTGAGFEIVGGTNLFRLARSSDAPFIYERLGRGGIYARFFPENPEWLRFGIPGKEEHWKRLEEALKF